ncbi:NAD-dependent epimerase/dehydratase family protein [Nodosilinea sp. LEGE 07298]|uniref:NAD-dependent epimerase/dehydratase family protein n=1 Tax=Nodosilinea sp. LEGE 07298 TaxID=2777970 RepID=UPI001880C2AB|nr:NAD-dependent epimerase/dehydratase family protein [Nodosilinea sp. LEGE 07298]MBE9113329.1 NAD-dependent epimerase/dehydratase family protein [Nodosilinea sp. LEGE 07298]
MTQTILGAGGAIGVELAKALPAFTSDLRLVGRNPKKVNETDQLFPADLTDKDQVEAAVAGSDICYLTVGLAYNTRLWQELWPQLIRHAAEACMRHRAKLVFFDNVYAIGGDRVTHITEASPISPTSQKGQVRAECDRYLQSLVDGGQLEAIIARSPDFFGPITATSVMMILVYDNLVKGKKAQWFCNADVVHSMGYTPELARGTALLGNTPDAYNQIWNLPVDSAAPTGRDWVQLFAGALHTEAQVQVFPAWAIKALGLFMPILKETSEMLYQYDRDYYFDASKFTARFNDTPITNAEAVRQTIEQLKKA